MSVRRKTVPYSRNGVFMLNLEMLSLMASQEIEKPNLFPFPFNMHLIFSALALVFFIYRFTTQKKPFQLILAIAIPLSLTVWISENRTWFYILGLIELILLVIAFITSLIFKKKMPAEENSSASEAAEGNTES